MADEVELPEFDRLLREELSIEPSPAFLPRVRARIEEAERGSRRAAWLWGWPVWQVASALTIILVAVWFVTRDGTQPSTQVPAGVIANGTPTREVVPPDPSPSAPVAVRPKIPAAASTQHRPDARARATAAATALEPAVIVDARQRVALREVMALVGAGKLTEESFVPAPPVGVEEIDVPPIAAGVVPVSASTTGGVQQKGFERDR